MSAKLDQASLRVKASKPVFSISARHADQHHPHKACAVPERQGQGKVPPNMALAGQRGQVGGGISSFDEAGKPRVRYKEKAVWGYNFFCAWPCQTERS